jgi:hypothetical protein
LGTYPISFFHNVGGKIAEWMKRGEGRGLIRDKATSDTATSVRKLNLREIAKRARVSTATVSRAINRIPTVNPYLAKRVWKVVEDLGYYPNTQARALVSGHSRIFGLIFSELKRFLCRRGSKFPSENRAATTAILLISAIPSLSPPETTATGPSTPLLRNTQSRLAVPH